MKISVPNQLKGKIADIKTGATTSHVSIDIGQGSILTASITTEAVADLDLRVGQGAWAIIKASDLLVAKSLTPHFRGARLSRVPQSWLAWRLFRKRAKSSRGGSAAEPHRD
jgi:molybdopterin-binding protein